MIDTSKNMLYHIANLNTESQRISYQMASGKILDKGSENSILHSNIINLEDRLRVTQGLMLQITKTKAMNEISDASLKEIKLALGTGENTIQTDLLKGLNSGMDRSDKLALATNLRGIRDNMFDRMNARVDGEYVFSGSDTTVKTLKKDDDYANNGKITFEGDGVLRKVAVQPGSYRDRGVTAYDAIFYNYSSYDRIDEKSDPENWDGVGVSGEQVVFEKGDRIIDQDGFEWKPNNIDGHTTKLQKYDYNGNIYYPPVEIDLYMTPEKQIRVDLGIGTNVDASGDYSIEINGTTYTSTVAGADANTVFADLKTKLELDGYTVDASLHEDDKFYIYSTSEMSWSTTDTDPKYLLGISNEIEGDSNVQSRTSTWTFRVPTTEPNLKFEAKHSYFKELNTVINALEGHSTMLDGTKGAVIDDEVVRKTLAKGLEQTSNQFDATNIGHGELGGRNNVFNISYDKLTSQETHYNILIQKTGASDTAKLAMESKALELTYQSLYTTISKMNKLSLLNYIN